LKIDWQDKTLQAFILWSILAIPLETWILAYWYVEGTLTKALLLRLIYGQPLMFIALIIPASIGYFYFMYRLFFKEGISLVKGHKRIDKIIKIIIIALG
jgi:hypothetical protein